MLLRPSSGNPIKCHEEVLFLQPVIPRSKRFDIFSPLTGGCSEGLDAFRFSLNKNWRMLRRSRCVQILKKILDASRSSEHPPVRGKSGGKMSKRLDGIMACKYKTSSLHLNGFPNGSNIIGSTVKPTVVLYTYINRRAGTPDKNKTFFF